MAEHAAGKPVRAIARTYGHSPGTVRDYVHGRRAPGEPAARADDFAPYITYCRQRLADDPHLRSGALLAEITGLGFPGTQRTFYRALERHEIQPHPCPHCHVARISGYYPLEEARHPQPSPLPVPVAPVNGETLASFLGRLAAVNRTSPDALLDILPPWFRIKTRWHDDRWQHDQLSPWADDAAARLAVISGSTTAAIKNALPAFGGKRGQPARAAIACRLCTAARRIREPVPVHLPAHHQVCIRHGIWLSGPGTPQFSVSGCPDILARRAPSPPAPPPLHHRAADLLQGPAGTRRPRRPRMETPDDNPHQDQPPAGHRIKPGGTVPGRGLPGSHHRSRSDLRQPQKLALSNLNWQERPPARRRKQASRASLPPSIDN